MAVVRVTGVKTVDRRLKRLALKDAKRIGRQAINKGMTPIVKQLRKETPKGPTGNLRKAVGKRNKKNRETGVQEAKVGYNVGLKHRKTKPGAKRKARRRAPHAHLVALGTKKRFWKSGKSTGKMPANKAVARAYRAAAPKAKQVMIQTVKEKIQQASRKR